LNFDNGNYVIIYFQKYKSLAVAQKANDHLDNKYY